MKNYSRKSLWLLATLVISFACSFTHSGQSNKKPKVWVNVFLHGIMSIKPHLSLANFIRFMTDSVTNTTYSETVRIMREDPLYYENQAMQGLGLHPMNPTTIKPGNASGAMAAAFETVSSFVNQKKLIENHYFTYGWTGLLSPSQRYKDAVILFDILQELATKFKKEGVDLKVRIISYSHGGNVALNLGAAHRDADYKPDFKIDELILLGVPIQNDTDYLINDPIFGKIYHLYSRGDRIQKLDFFSFKRFFSRRLFKERRGFKLPNKLIQIQVKCTRASRTAVNDKNKFATTYNFRNRNIISGKSRYLRDMSPGHAELWFFGWTPLHYRTDDFPLTPLPIAAILPLIIRDAENFEHCCIFQKPTLIDIRPEHNVVIIKNQKSKKLINIANFLPKKTFCDLCTLVEKYKPINYTDTRYTQHIKQAHNQAKTIRKRASIQTRLNKKKEKRERKRNKKEMKQQKRACKRRKKRNKPCPIHHKH